MGMAGFCEGQYGRMEGRGGSQGGGGGQKGREGQGSGTYLGRCPGGILLISASSEAWAADVLLFRTSIA